MKILMVTASSGSRGGGEFYFQVLAAGLVQSGHSVVSAMSDGQHMDEFAEAMAEFGEVMRLPYVNTYHRRMRTLGAIVDFRTSARWVDFLKYRSEDVVHLNKQNLEDGLDLYRAVHACGKPGVTTIHVTRSMSRLGAAAGGIRDLLTRRELKRKPGPLIGTSSICTEELRDFVGADYGGGIYNVPNGAFRGKQIDRQRFRNSWGIKDGQIVLGTVARIEAQKNPLFVAQLLTRLPSHVRMVWVGDGSLRSALEAECTRLGVRDRLHIDGWQSDGRDRMAGFDLFVLPSVYEGFPFAILESKSQGLACVVSDVDGIKNGVVDSVDGYLCRVNDLDGWVRAILPLIQDGMLREDVGNAARESYERDFSQQAMAERTVNVYKDVIRQYSGC